MKKFFIVMLLLCYFLSGCTNIQEKVDVERPEIFKEEISVVVTNIAKNHWFASTHWYEVEVTVENKEYGLTKTFYFNGSGAFGCPLAWSYEKNDELVAKMYIWKVVSTQEIVKREIGELK